MGGSSARAARMALAKRRAGFQSRRTSPLVLKYTAALPISYGVENDVFRLRGEHEGVPFSTEAVEKPVTGLSGSVTAISTCPEM